MSKKEFLKDLKHLPDYVPPPPRQVVAIVSGGPFGPEWRFTFGRYGRTKELLQDIIEDDPEYINWALENVQGFTLTPCAQQMLRDVWEDRRVAEGLEEDVITEEEFTDDDNDR